MPPIAMPDKTCERVIGTLSGGGVICVRQYGAQVLTGCSVILICVDKGAMYRDTAYFDRHSTP